MFELKTLQEVNEAMGALFEEANRKENEAAMLREEARTIWKEWANSIDFSAMNKPTQSIGFKF